jgi:hypothetical protein
MILARLLHNPVHGRVFDRALLSADLPVASSTVSVGRQSFMPTPCAWPATPGISEISIRLDSSRIAQEK